MRSGGGCPLDPALDSVSQPERPIAAGRVRRIEVADVRASRAAVDAYSLGSRALWRGSPLRPPLWWIPACGDVDRLTCDLVAAELEDAYPELPRTLVVADRDLSDPEVISTSDLSEVDRRGRWIGASPLSEVLNSHEALAGLGELENRVVVVHLVVDGRIATGEVADDYP
jgi:hypothetical protein